MHDDPPFLPIPSRLPILLVLPLVLPTRLVPAWL